MISTRVLRIVWLVLIGALMFGLIALLAVQMVSAKAGAISWEFDEQPVIREVDGYWVINPGSDPERRCYSQPKVSQVWKTWLVECTSGNEIYKPGGNPYPEPADEFDWGCFDAWYHGVWCNGK